MQKLFFPLTLLAARFSRLVFLQTPLLIAKLLLFSFNIIFICNIENIKKYRQLNVTWFFILLVITFSTLIRPHNLQCSLDRAFPFRWAIAGILLPIGPFAWIVLAPQGQDPLPGFKYGLSLIYKSAISGVGLPSIAGKQVTVPSIPRWLHKYSPFDGVIVHCLANAFFLQHFRSRLALAPTFHHFYCRPPPC